MARTYAGILGSLAFLISLARGLIHAWSVEKTLLVAWTTLLAFAVLGSAIGWFAQRIIDEEIRGRIAAERGEANESGGPPTAPAAPPPGV